jgi:hypothetical protein
MTLLDTTALQDLYEKVERHVRGENQGNHAKKRPYRKPCEPKDVQHRRARLCSL